MKKLFITIKSHSERCPNKNVELLPYALDKLSHIDDIYPIIITDSTDLVKDVMNVEIYIEDRFDQCGELYSIYKYITKVDGSFDDFILFSVCHPFLNIDTIRRVIEEDITEYDFATTYANIYNRGIFLLNNDFSYKCDSWERKGCLCTEDKMIDGSIYKIKVDFLEDAVYSYNFNHYFWNNSKIKFVENSSKLFVDVDHPKDLELFYLLKNKIEVENL